MIWRYLKVGDHFESELICNEGIIHWFFIYISWDVRMFIFLNDSRFIRSHFIMFKFILTMTFPFWAHGMETDESARNLLKSNKRAVHYKKKHHISLFFCHLVYSQKVVRFNLLKVIHVLLFMIWSQTVSLISWDLSYICRFFEKSFWRVDSLTVCNTLYMYMYMYIYI